VAVVDADSGVLLSLTAFSGEQPALHAELRELTFEPQPATMISGSRHRRA